MLHEETNGEALITTGVGQHQMWAAQWYKLKEPRQWATSGGLGSMGFGLPSALGAATAYDGTDKGRPKRVRPHIRVCSTFPYPLYSVGSLSEYLWSDVYDMHEQKHIAFVEGHSNKLFRGEHSAGTGPQTKLLAHKTET